MREIDSDVVALDLDREARNRKSIGVVGIEPGSDVEGPTVGVTRDDTAVELALGERIAGVGAGIFHRVDGVVHAIESDADSIDYDP